MKFAAKLHSFVDLITNSSTEIFINFSGLVEPLKEMINASLVGTGKTCDDIFNITVMPEWAQDDPEEWEAIKNNWRDDGEGASPILHFELKDETYAELGNAVKKLLDSIDTEERYC